MNLSLSWDLFIMAVFVIIIAYSFIIGLNKTVKTIIGIYLSILTADGLGNIFRNNFLDSENFQKVLGIFQTSSSTEMLISFKVIVFAIAVVILTVKGAYEAKISARQLHSGGVIATFAFGFMSAGLIVSTILMYISGLSLIQSVTLPSNIIDLYTNSNFVRIMIDYYDFWFAIPVIIIIGWSLILGEGND